MSIKKKGAHGGIPIEWSMVSESSATDATDYTFNNVAVGAAGVGRAIIVVAHVVDNGTVSFSAACEYNGFNMTELDKIHNVNDSCVGIWGYLDDSDTTPNIEVHMTPNCQACHINVYRVMHLKNGLTPVDTNTDSGDTSSSLTVSVNVLPGDLIIAGGTNEVSTGSTTTEGITEDDDGSVESSIRACAGSHLAIISETPRTITFDWSDVTQRTAAAVALR
jgi:hypothetical protein